MESGIKYNNLRYIRQNFPAGTQCQSMTVIVNRCQFPQLINLINDSVGYHCGLCKDFCTLHNSMSNSRNFLHILDHSSLTGGQSLYQASKCF